MEGRDEEWEEGRGGREGSHLDDVGGGFENDEAKFPIRTHVLPLLVQVTRRHILVVIGRWRR
jgi:hypothetical protein